MSAPTQTRLSPPRLLHTYACLFILVIVIGTLMYGYRVLVLEAPETKAPPGPTLRIADGRDNFGEVWENSEFEWVAPIENLSAEPITITGFHSSCNCLKIEPRQLTIPAGESREAKFTLDLTAKPRPDETEKQAVREFGVYIAPEIQPTPSMPPRFIMRGRVKNSVYLDKSVLDMGHHSELAQPVPSKKLGLLAAGVVKDVTAQSASESFTVQVERVDSVPGRFELTVKAPNTLSRGFHCFEVHVIPCIGNGQKLPPKKLAVELRIQRDIQVSPPSVAFGARRLGETVEETLILGSLTGQRFEVVSGRTDGESLSVEPVNLAHTESIYRVLQRIEKTSGQKGQVIFRVRDETHREEDVSVTITYVGIAVTGGPTSERQEAMKEPTVPTMTVIRLQSLGLVMMLGGNALFMPHGVLAQAKSEVSLETIAKAWMQRQEATKSAKFTWTKRTTIPKGFLTSVLPGPLGEKRLLEMGIPKGSTVPPDDTTFELPVKLFVEGLKLRYEYEDRDWSVKESKYVKGYKISSFDGKVCKSLCPEGTTTHSHPQGHVRKEANHYEGRSMMLAPILMHFRSQVPVMSVYPIGELEVTGRTAVIDGHRCVELQHPPRGMALERLWVDATRDYVIVRCLDTNGDQTTLKLDVQFTRDKVHGWLPTGWDYVAYNVQGKLTSLVKAMVTSYEINTPIEASEFDIVFPPGTSVIDDKSNQHYVIKSDGVPRPILRQDLGASHQQLMSTAPGEAFGTSSAGPSHQGSSAETTYACSEPNSFLLRRLRNSYSSSPTVTTVCRPAVSATASLLLELVRTPTTISGCGLPRTASSSVIFKTPETAKQPAASKRVRSSSLATTGGVTFDDFVKD